MSGPSVTDPLYGSSSSVLRGVEPPPATSTSPVPRSVVVFPERIRIGALAEPHVGGAETAERALPTSWLSEGAGADDVQLAVHAAAIASTSGSTSKTPRRESRAPARIIEPTITRKRLQNSAIAREKRNVEGKPRP